MCYSINDIDDIDDVRLLARTVRELTAISDPGVLFVRICEALGRLTAYDWSVLALVDHEGALRIVHSFGRTHQVEGGLEFPSRGGLGGNAVTLQTAQLIHGPHAVDPVTLEVLTTPLQDAASISGAIDYESFIGSPAGAVVAQPVIHGGVVVAVIYGGYRSAKAHDHSSLAMVSEYAAFVAPLVVSAIRASDLEVLAKAEERQRIVRHLHDTSLQLLFRITLSTRSLLTGSVLDPSTQSMVKSIAQDALGASECLRNTFEANLPAERALVIAVREMTKAFSARSSVPAEVTTLGTPRSCVPAVDRLLLVATREILHNIEKHARASNVSIGITYGTKDLTLVIQDDGVGLPVGFEPAVTPRGRGGIGLSSVEQAAAALGGEIVCSSNEDGGTTVRVRVPAAEPQAA